MKKRTHGTGAIIHRKGTNNLYIRYWQDGRQIQEAVGSPSEAEAEKMLQDRMSDSRKGAVAAQDIKQLRYEDLRDSYLKVKPEQEQYFGLQYLDSFFKDMRVDRITAQVIENFIEHRREEDEVSDPTIRRNLVCLRAMFNLARKKGQLGLRDVPYFSMPADSDAAGEYIEPEAFSKVLAELPSDLQPFFSFMYATGCRLGAAQKITWEMVNASCDVLNLPGSITKTKKPLLIVLDGPMLAPVVAILRKQFRRDGQAVFDSTNYRPEWAKAVAKAGLGTWDAKARTRTGVRIHDCRCSAAINLLDAGVDEGTVLKIGGWKTRAMLDRYNVQNEKRIRKAMKQGGEFVAAQIGGQA
jgi:integrase